MNNVMGIILSGSRNNRLKELTLKRSLIAVPVGGKYRVVDFVLSNMVNSGITNIGIMAQYNFRSLMDHLGSGKEWDLDRKTNGLFIFPSYLSENGSGWYRGSADAMYNNISFLKRSNEDYVVIAGGNCVYKMTFDDMIKYHQEKNSDITIAYRDMIDYSSDELSQLGLMKIDERGRVIDFQERPLQPWITIGSMGVYVVSRRLLISLLEESAAHGNYDFVKDILIKKLDSLRVYGYQFCGYWRNLSTIQMYYRCNMEMLKPEVMHELFAGESKVYTKIKDEVPAKYNDEAEVRNSIVADGCIIEGMVENSVLFRGVNVKKGAVIKDSIIMQGTVVEENAQLQYVILDKEVCITHGKQLKGDPAWPVIVGKNVVV